MNLEISQAILETQIGCKYSVKAIQRQTVVGSRMWFRHLCLFSAKGCVWIAFTEYLRSSLLEVCPFLSRFFSSGCN